MRKFVLALLAASFVIGPGHVMAAAPDYRAQFALDYVCDYYMLSCDGLAVPQIVYVDSVALFGFQFYGAYSTSAYQTIFVDWSVQRDSQHLLEVIVHEMAHYVDLQRVFRVATSCEREAMAFQVMNAWAVEYGYAPDLDWYVRYGCPADIQVAL